MEGPPPCWGPMAVGTPRSSGTPQGPHPVLPQGSVVSSSVQGSVWGGYLGAQSCRHVFHPLCTFMPRPDVEGTEGTAGGRRTPTLPQFMGTSGLRQMEGPWIMMGRETVQAFGGKSLSSRATSGPEDPERRM